MTTRGNVGDVRPHSVEQQVEWFYAFDIHCNAFFVVRSQELLLSCVAQTGSGCFPINRLWQRYQIHFQVSIWFALSAYIWFAFLVMKVGNTHTPPPPLLIRCMHFLAALCTNLCVAVLLSTDSSANESTSVAFE